MPGIGFALTDRVREQIKKLLPFKPTNAQKRVLKEIAEDMSRPSPMNRLLQGDVGSGKTIVAAEAAVIALENGYQVAILAPTEILAAQHYFSLRPLLRKVGYVTALLTGSSTAREKQKLKEMLRSGLIPVAMGTHALIEKDVEFAKLGLVIIDEQHRFGVMQRFELAQKGMTPDVLVMTATPIPRTLAMTLYGDLDVSVIDEMPPGRKQDPDEALHGGPDRTGLQRDPPRDRCGPPGLRGLPGHRRVRDPGDEGGAADVRAPLAARSSPTFRSACCTGGSGPAKKRTRWRLSKAGARRFWFRRR